MFKLWLHHVLDNLSEGADTLYRCSLDLKYKARIIAQDGAVEFVHLTLRSGVIAYRGKQPHHVTAVQSASPSSRSEHP